MWIGCGPDLQLSDFADDAFGGAISDAWLDNTTSRTSPGPTTSAGRLRRRANEADATDRLFNERYDDVFFDPNSIGWWHVTYIPGCDPANETAL